MTWKERKEYFNAQVSPSHIITLNDAICSSKLYRYGTRPTHVLCHNDPNRRITVTTAIVDPNTTTHLKITRNSVVLSS